MEEKEQKENVIKILRNNHFVHEYLEQNGISPEITRNPRFQSIIWNISVKLQQNGIDFSQDNAAYKWMQNNIKIGQQGEVMYVISGKESYYSNNLCESRVQFVKYFNNGGTIQREVREIDEEGKQGLHILSSYNMDGIEEEQFLDDKQSKYYFNIKRIKNRPDLKVVLEYDKEQKRMTNIDYEGRVMFEALEDLTPNMIEIDPLGVNPKLKKGAIQCYVSIRIKDEKKFYLPLPEKDREEQLQYYKRLNENYHITKIFETGIAKLLYVRNREMNK